MLSLSLGHFAEAQARAFTYTHSLSAAKIQEWIQPAFTPAYRGKVVSPGLPKAPAVEYALSNPVIRLVRGSDRIDLTLDVEIKMPLVPVARGTANLTSGVTYVSKEYAFYLVDPQIVSLTLPAATNRYQALIQKTMQYAIQVWYAKSPVYVIGGEQLRQRLVRAVLKSVVVNPVTGEIEITIGV